MSDFSQTPPPSASPAGRPRTRWRRVLVALLGAFGVLLGGTAVGLYLVVDRLDGNITTQDVSADLGTRPAADKAEGEPLNILMMGSDTREGQGEGFGAFEGPGRSDTTLLLHIAADRQSATAVSFPRDLWIEIPDCSTDNGSTGTFSTKFNAAFAYGGPACTIKAVESITNIFIDHYMVVDFTGFESVVDALGGVEVCLEESVDDPDSGLDLPAGVTTVDGEQALAFVRTRKTLADGSDTARIERQQEFLSSMIREATNSQLLRSPTRLFAFLDEATSAVTTDPGLGSVRRLAGLAQELRGLTPGDITFVTAPSQPRGDGANVELVEPQASALFTALREDEPWPPPTPKPEDVTIINGQPLLVPSTDIQVRVLNGTKIEGRAQDTADALAELGFVIAGVGVADRDDYTYSKLIAGSGTDEVLRTLSAATGIERTQQNAASADVVTLIVGSGLAAPSPVVAAPPTTPPATEEPTLRGAPRSAQERICAS